MLFLYFIIFVVSLLLLIPLINWLISKLNKEGVFDSFNYPLGKSFRHIENILKDQETVLVENHKYSSKYNSISDIRELYCVFYNPNYDLIAVHKTIDRKIIISIPKIRFQVDLPKELSLYNIFTLLTKSDGYVYNFDTSKFLTDITKFNKKYKTSILTSSKDGIKNLRFKLLINKIPHCTSLVSDENHNSKEKTYEITYPIKYENIIVEHKMMQ